MRTDGDSTLHRPRIKRTTIIVRDINRSRAFYRDVLGFSVWYDRDFEFSGNGFPGTRKGDHCRLVIMEARDPEIGKIGLLQYVQPAVDAPPPSYEFLGPGRVVFVGEIEDCAAMEARVRGAGGRVLTPTHPFEVIGADGRLKRMNRVCFFDPDGNLFELNEPPHEPP